MRNLSEKLGGLYDGSWRFEMGAMAWQEMGPWYDDARESLRRVQAVYLDKHYDLPTLIARHLKSVKQAIEITVAEGDRFNLLGGYRQELAMLESMSREPLPASAEDRVGMVRKIYASSGQGIGNVLDVTSASPDGGFLVSRILTDAELRDVFGTSKPNRELAKTAISRLSSHIDRGESVCFPVFAESGQPIGWWFAGYTID